MCLEFYNATTPKARKEYKCEYCNQIIPIGEKHSHETGKYDGDMFSRRLDFTCYNIMSEYCNINSEDEFTWDGIDDWLQDKYCYDCKHGIREEDDCDQERIAKCQLIRKNFDKLN